MIAWLTWLLVLFLAVAVVAQAERPEAPRHPDPVVQGVQDHLDRLCLAHDARLNAIDTPERLQTELAARRSRFIDLLDLDLKAPRQAPPVRHVETLDFPAYRIEKLVVETAPGVPVPCSLYVPRTGPTCKPALLIPHGHSGRDRPVYQNGYQRFAKAGFLVLAKDGWGKQERRGTGHGAEGGQLFLTGTSLMALELWDNVRLVDFLLSRADVDPERLGMVGLSGGGSQTLYTMAIEPRLKAGSPTGAVTTFRADLADTTMCVCELHTDLLTLGDHGLFLALAFPRPVLVVNGTRDPIFPIAGARAAAKQARGLYAIGGQAERVRFAEFDAGHEWSDPMISLQVHWFREQLGLPPLPDPPPGDGPLPYARLRCFPDGDLPSGSLTLTGLNRRRMAAPAPAGPGSPGREEAMRRHQQRLRSRWSGEPELPARLTRGEPVPDASRLFSRETLSWPSGLGGTVSAVITRPLDPEMPAARRLVIRLDRDRQVPQLDRLYWDDRFRTQAVVVELEYTGRRLSPVQEGQVGTALLTSGRFLLAERVRDLLVLLQVLRQEQRLEGDTELVLVGYGFDGALLLAAGPLLPETARLVLDSTPVTYAHGAEIDFTTPDLLAPPAHWTLLPGVARDGDLLRLAALAAPRRILLLHPQDAARQRLSRAKAEQLLAPYFSPQPASVEVVGREAGRSECLARLNRLVSNQNSPGGE